MPILVADQVPGPATTPNTDQVTYLPGAQDQASEVAWWAIADSGGKANGIIAEEIGNPSSIAQVTSSLAIYKKYEGRALTDEILRMATGSAPVQETIPDRLFSKQNIGTIQVTTADQALGAWFGSTSSEGEFAKLWGVG